MRPGVMDTLAEFCCHLQRPNPTPSARGRCVQRWFPLRSWFFLKRNAPSFSRHFSRPAPPQAGAATNPLRLAGIRPTPPKFHRGPCSRDPAADREAVPAVDARPVFPLSFDWNVCIRNHARSSVFLSPSALYSSQALRSSPARRTPLQRGIVPGPVLPSNTRPLKRGGGCQNPADRVPTRPWPGPCARFRRQRGEWPRSGNAGTAELITGEISGAAAFHHSSNSNINPETASGGGGHILPDPHGHRPVLPGLALIHHLSGQNLVERQYVRLADGLLGGVLFHMA